MGKMISHHTRQIKLWVFTAVFLLVSSSQSLAQWCCNGEAGNVVDYGCVVRHTGVYSYVVVSGEVDCCLLGSMEMGMVIETCAYEVLPGAGPACACLDLRCSTCTIGPFVDHGCQGSPCNGSGCLTIPWAPLWQCCSGAALPCPGAPKQECTDCTHLIKCVDCPPNA